MKLHLIINDKDHEIEAVPGESLLKTLRRLGYYSAKHGCESGECGACAVLVDGKPVNSCLFLAAQAEGARVETIEELGEHPEQGWKITSGLHPLQQAFVETGAIQCGYCTPAQILAAKELLDRKVDPSEDEVRQALAGVLCRCTDYIKPVQAVLRAAAIMRGERVEPISGTPDERAPIPAPQEWFQEDGMPSGGEPLIQPPGEPGAVVDTRQRVMPRIQRLSRGYANIMVLMSRKTNICLQRSPP